MEIEKLLRDEISSKEQEDGEERPTYTRKVKKYNKNDPRINFQEIAFQLSGGFDLSEVEGIGRTTLVTLLSETNLDLSAFPTAKHFASWLHLSPNNKVSGGKMISSRTVKGRNRLAQALRYSANAIGCNLKGGSLHQFFRRIAYRKGHFKAITATARKLAVIIWNMLTYKKSYQPLSEDIYLNKVRSNQLKSLQRRINQLNIQAGELNFAT